MDKLAEEGVYFSNAFVTSPVCAASRASIYTGLYERTHGFTFGTPPLKKEYARISFPELLKKSGYHVGLFGKLGFWCEDEMEKTLFDELYDTNPNGYFRLKGEANNEHVHLTDFTTDKAIDFIKNTPGQTPFCLILSYNAPHADDAHPQQYFWPERHNNLYADFELPQNDLISETYFQKLPPFLKDSLYTGRIRWRWRFNTAEKYDGMVKGYYRMITTIDDNIGRLREFLKNKGLAENTVIIFMGDNGYFLNERYLAGKWLMYENSIRVPLIVFDPRLQPSVKQVSQMALNIDIAPTILNYAGVPVPGIVQGKSLLDFIEGTNNSRKFFICEHLYNNPNIPKSEGIRSARWKYFHYVDYTEVEEFYDLVNDPFEKHNLIDEKTFADTISNYKLLMINKIKELESITR
jgi:arylsulfatase A-like enzyme